MAVYLNVGIFSSMDNDNASRKGRSQVPFTDKQPQAENCVDALEKRIAELSKRVDLLERLVNACAQHLGIRI